MPIDHSKVSDGYHSFKELYTHRNLLYLAFLYERPESSGRSWRSRLHNDGSSFDGWFVVGTELQMDNEAVQITYHLPDDLWSSCHFLETLDKAPHWDGHTPNDVVERLQKFLSRHTEKEKAPPMRITEDPRQLHVDGKSKNRTRA